MIGPIIINPEALHGGVSKLHQLKSGSKMGKEASSLFTMSKSETSDAVIEMYQQLQETEKAFVELVEKTIQAMVAAGVSFQNADKNAVNTFGALGGSTMI